MKYLKVIILLALCFPLISLANGGDQRVVENKYFISLSKSPFTPRVGQEDSMLASFVDVATNQLIQEDIIVKIRIAKQGEEKERKFIFEQDNIKVEGGVLPIKYTFEQSGFHELFIDFAFVSNPQRIYEVPDFLMDVQPAETSDGSMWNMMRMMMGWGWPMMIFGLAIWILVVILLVLAIVWLIRQVKK